MPGHCLGQLGLPCSKLLWLTPRPMACAVRSHTGLQVCQPYMSDRKCYSAASITKTPSTPPTSLHKVHTTCTVHTHTHTHVCSSLVNATVKELLKLGYICQSFRKNKSGTLFFCGTHYTVNTKHLS